MKDEKQNVIRLGFLLRGFVSLFTLAGIVALKAGALISAEIAPVLWITIVNLFLNVPYYLLHNRFGRRDVQIALYVAVDVCFITVVAHYLGGIDAFYAIYGYILIILFCHFYLTRRIAIVLTGIAVLCYTGLIGLELAGVLPNQPSVIGLHEMPAWAQGLLAGFNVFVMVLLSVFAGRIAGKMEKKTAEVLRANRIIAEQNRNLGKEVEKRTAELHHAQKMESVGRLAGGVAHDFNNMLTIILGHAELVQRNLEAGDPLRESLQEVLTAGRRSSDLVQQLLAFARKQVVAPRVLDLNETIESMLKMLARLIGAEIDFEWKPGPDLWPVRIDPAQVNQILVNLAVNARDAISGHGTIRLETGNLSFPGAGVEDRGDCPPGEHVFVSVSDNGCGMDRETLEQIFEPFFTTKPMGKGTGLGMPTVFGIVQQNEGFIRVNSEPGAGTTVRICLPRAQAEAPGPAKTQDRVRPTGGNETLLLVEDEPGLLELAVSALKPLGYAVLAAGTPTRALRLAESHSGEIHLLVTDLVMPEMSGLDLWKRLKQRRPGLRSLLVSGYPADVLARHGMLEQEIPLLKKPFSVEDLAARIRRELDRPGVP